MIKVLFFARLREELGQAEISLSGEAAPADIGELLALLKSRGDAWDSALSRDNLLCAVNQEQAGPEQVITDGDEVAFFPPVTGG